MGNGNFKDFDIYGGTKSLKGGAVTFTLRDNAVMVKASKQIEERKFDWDNAVFMKLNASELGELVLLFSGRKNDASIYHESAKGQSEGTRSTKFEAKKGDRSAFVFTFYKTPAKGEQVRVFVPVSEGDAEALRVLFEKAILEINGW